MVKSAAALKMLRRVPPESGMSQALMQMRDDQSSGDKQRKMSRKRRSRERAKERREAETMAFWRRGLEGDTGDRLWWDVKLKATKRLGCRGRGGADTGPGGRVGLGLREEVSPGPGLGG